MRLEVFEDLVQQKNKKIFDICFSLLYLYNKLFILQVLIKYIPIYIHINLNIQLYTYIPNPSIPIHPSYPTLMMHNTPVAFQHQSIKKANLYKQNSTCKNIGSYISVPLPDKIISNRIQAGRVVFKAMVIDCPAQQGKQYLNCVPTQMMTCKILNLQKLSQQNIKVKKQFRRHLRIDIKQYLKRRYQKQTYQLPLQSCQILRIYKQSQPQNLNKTKFLHIYKPFYYNDNLKTKQQTNHQLKQQLFKKNQLGNYFRQLLKCSVQFGGLDNFIMTTSNVYIDQDLTTLQINYTSFTGLSLVKAQGKIHVHQYFQIGPYLTANMLLNGQIGIQQKIRFFLINCISIINGKDFYFIKSHPQQAQKVHFHQDIKNQFIYGNQLSPQVKQQFRLFLTGDQAHKKRMKYCQKYKLPALFQRALINDQKLTWKQIVQAICIGEDEVHKTDVKYGQFIQKSFRNLHDQLWREQQDKQFYLQRGLQSNLLYIPIKYRAKLNYIFLKKSWWQIFNIRNQQGKPDPTRYNFEHQNFCYSLLSVIMDRYYFKPANQEQAKKFKQDPIIQIIFQYLNASQLSSITEIKEGEQKKYILFSQIYMKFDQLVKKMDKIKGK